MAAAFEHDIEPNRTDLLPWWIRYCNWLFLLGIISVPAAMILSLLGNDTLQLAAFGLCARDFFTPTGLLLSGVILYNAFTAYALLTESDWAIDLGIVAAFINMALCFYTMSAEPGTFRYELVASVFFLIKLLGIRTTWEHTPGLK